MWYIIHSIQFCILWKLAEAALCHIIQIINEDIEQQQWQYLSGGTLLVTILQLKFVPLITTI